MEANRQSFSTTSGATVEFEVEEKDGCIITSQRFKLPSGFSTQQCTVTCSTGKSYSWTCPNNKRCAGDCNFSVAVDESYKDLLGE